MLIFKDQEFETVLRLALELPGVDRHRYLMVVCDGNLDMVMAIDRLLQAGERVEKLLDEMDERPVCDYRYSEPCRG